MVPQGQDFFSLGELLLLALAAGHALALVAALHALGSQRPHSLAALLAIPLAILRRLAIVDGVYVLIVPGHDAEPARAGSDAAARRRGLPRASVRGGRQRRRRSAGDGSAN